MVDYLLALKEAAREVNPNVVFFEETWNVDPSGATGYAGDPAAYLPTRTCLPAMRSAPSATG